MNNVLPYYLFPDNRTILFIHPKLYDSWYERRISRAEGRMKKFESVIKASTGLNRIWRRNYSDWWIVKFRMNREQYTKAAVAVSLSFQRDTFYDRLFKQFIHENANSI